jgi:hypothetical protein
VVTPIEVTLVRLYCKGGDLRHPRKSAAAELERMLAAGWQEKGRREAGDHVVVRLERRRPVTPTIRSTRA